MITSNNRCCIIIAFLFFFSNYVFSQDTISNSYRDKIEITTSFGLSIPRSDFMKHSNIGIRTMTGFQYRYNKSIFFRAVYEISLYSFTNSRSVDGFSVINKGNRSLIGAFVDIGSNTVIGDRIEIGGFTGFGLLWLTSPFTEVQGSVASINTRSETKAYETYRLGGFASYRVNKKFALYIELQHFNALRRSHVFDSKLGGTNIALGFRTNLSNQKR